MAVYTHRSCGGYIYSSDLATTLNKLRKQNQLCDIIINIGGRAFNAHKVVLGACTNYFMTMFTSGFKESTQKEVNIDGNADVFEALLDYMYTGNLTMTLNTVYEILEMANYMQFIKTDLIAKPCYEFIIKAYANHSTPNAISMGDAFKLHELACNLRRAHSYKYEYDHFISESKTYLCNHFLELKGAEEFLNTASVEFIKSCLERADFSSKDGEKEVLEVVVTWLKHDWANRKTHALELLQKVRLGFISGDTLNNLLHDEFISEMADCKQLLEEVITHQESGHSMDVLAQMVPHFFATRGTTTAPISYSRDVGFYYYDVIGKRWCKLAKLENVPSRFASLIVINRVLYAAGGCHRYHDTKCKDIFLRYDAEDNIWERLAPMQTARHSSLLVHIDGYIYAIAGGNRDGKTANEVERFNIDLNQWEIMSSLPNGFHWVSSIVYEGMILVYGVSEKISESLHVQHVVMVYHTTTDRWQTALSEQFDAGTTHDSFGFQPPVLFIYKGICHRLVFNTRRDRDGSLPKWKMACIQKPSVQILKLEAHRNRVTLTVGEEEFQQDMIPTHNPRGVFRIKEEVFMSKKGLVYKTDVKISSDQSDVVSLTRDDFTPYFGSWHREHSNIVWFTFDKKYVATRNFFHHDL